jgi:antitoxin HigA-1
VTSTKAVFAERVFLEGEALETARPLYPGIHPGLLLFEALAERGLSTADFARHLGLSVACLSRVERCTSPVSVELALLFGKAFGQSPLYWLAQQAEHDLFRASDAMADRLARVEYMPLLRAPTSSTKASASDLP